MGRAQPVWLLPRRLLAGLLAVAVGSSAAAQTLYKYRGANGEWIFADRPPADGVVDEVRHLGAGKADAEVRVMANDSAKYVSFVAYNPIHAPVQLKLRFKSIRGLDEPNPTERLTWVLPPSSRTDLLSLRKNVAVLASSISYEFEYMVGDPAAQPVMGTLYRVPFAVASNFPVTQAFPDTITHTTRDSRFAVDIAMPIGTDVFAARNGIVFSVSSNNFKSGTDLSADGPRANIVQILHDDGTYAIYAHLNWNSIRVKAGDYVTRGQYIADSGNTGFSSGPHLHFAVLRNAGMNIVSVPLTFEGANESAVRPATGQVLFAY
ncbi:MAG TPA: M23 family metallopeptidase [Woeseiaceae bacterium]|nr:M23 family metallopeptidase [Woeseiaceae bacterium]